MISSVSKDSKLRDFAAVTCFFNFSESKLREQAYVEFCENLKEQGKATGGMVKMVGMLTTIDQVGCWDDAYNSHLFKNFSEAKKKVKHSDLDALDNDLPEGEIPF